MAKAMASKLFPNNKKEKGNEKEKEIKNTAPSTKIPQLPPVTAAAVAGEVKIPTTDKELVKDNAQIGKHIDKSDNTPLATATTNTTTTAAVPASGSSNEQILLMIFCSIAVLVTSIAVALYVSQIS